MEPQRQRHQFDIPSRSPRPALIINRHTRFTPNIEATDTSSASEVVLDVVEETVISVPAQDTRPTVGSFLAAAPKKSIKKQSSTSTFSTRQESVPDYVSLIQAELDHLNHPRIKRGLAKTAHKAQKLADSTAIHIPVVAASDTIEPKKKVFLKKPHLVLPRTATYVIIAAIIVGTSYLGFDVWSTNNQLKNELSATAKALGSPNPSARQKSEGRDETDVTADMIRNYVVMPSMPRIVTIKDAKINARVLPMDVNPDNSVQAPVNVFDAGWYTGSAKPGEPGAALIDGHSSGATRQGEFAYLDLLQVGDLVEVERGDGQKLTYEVAYKEIVALKDVDMKKLLLPYGDNAQGLNLITCTGKSIKNKDGSFTYDHRVLVYTKRVS